MGLKTERVELRTTKDYSQGLKPNGVYPIAILNCFGLLTHFLPFIYLSLVGDIYNCSPTLVISLNFRNKLFIPVSQIHRCV